MCQYLTALFPKDSDHEYLQLVTEEHDFAFELIRGFIVDLSRCNLPVIRFDHPLAVCISMAGIRIVLHIGTGPVVIINLAIGLTRNSHTRNIRICEHNILEPGSFHSRNRRRKVRDRPRAFTTSRCQSV